MVHLDDDDLELTKECRAALDVLNETSKSLDNDGNSMLEAQDVFNFCDLYGTFYKAPPLQKSTRTPRL